MAWKLNRWRLIGGLIIAVFFGLTGIFVINRGDSRRQALEQTPLLQPEQLGRLQTGEQYVLSGDIDARSPTVLKNLVMACEERLSSNKKQATGWRTVRLYPNTIQLRLDHQTRVSLRLDQKCPLGRLEHHYDPQSSSHLWKGYVAGQNLTALVEVTSTTPPGFKGLDHRSGSRGEFLNSLGGQHLEDSLFFGVFVLIGLLLAFWPVRPAPAKKT